MKFLLEKVYFIGFLRFFKKCIFLQVSIVSDAVMIGYYYLFDYLSVNIDISTQINLVFVRFDQPQSLPLVPGSGHEQCHVSTSQR